MVVVVLVVLGAGLGAGGLYLGLFGTTSTDVATTTPRPCVTTAAPLDPRRVRVNVYNASGRTGLASRTADDLRARRFAIGAVTNDPTGAKVTAAALIRYGRTGSASAKLVATQLRGATLVADKRPNAVVDLVLGAAFTGLSPVATTTATPTCAATPARSAVPKTRPTTTPR